MSIAIALIGTDGIVVAADDRVTAVAGNMLIRDSGAKKIWKIKDRYGLLAVNVNNGLSDWMIDNFLMTLNTPKTNFFLPERVKDVFHEISNTYEGIVILFSANANNIYDSYGINIEVLQKNEMFRLSFTLAGYTSLGAPLIHLLSSSSRFIPERYDGYLVSGIPEIGHYYIRKCRELLFERRENIIMPKTKMDTLMRFAAFVIIETAKYNQSVGSAVKMCTITKEQGIQDIPAETVDDIIKAIRKITDDNKLMRMLKS